MERFGRRLLKAVKRKRYFLRTLSILVCFCMAVSLIAIYLLINMSYKTMEESYIDSSQSLLQQTQKAVELSIRNVMVHMNSLLYSPDIIRGSVAYSLMNNANTVQLISQLSSAQETLQLVDYVGYYVLTADIAYDSESNITSVANALYADVLQQYLEHEEEATRIGNGGIVCDIMLFNETVYFFQSYPGLQYDSQSYLMFAISPSYFSEILQRGDDNAWLSVYDKNGKIVTSGRQTDAEIIPTDQQTELLKLVENSGVVVSHEPGNHDLDVFFLKDDQGWLYLYGVSRDTGTLSYVIQLADGNNILFLFGLLLLISVFVCGYLTKKLYFPIQFLIGTVESNQVGSDMEELNGELDYLNHAYGSMVTYQKKIQKVLPVMQTAMQESLFRHLIAGEPILEQQILEQLEIVRSRFRVYDCYGVILFEFHIASQNLNSEMCLQLAFAQVECYLRERMDERGCVFSFLKGKRLVAVCSFPPFVPREEILENVKVLCGKRPRLEKVDGVYETVGYSEYYPGIESVHKAYQEAECYLNVNRYYVREKVAAYSQAEKISAYCSSVMQGLIQNISVERIAGANDEMMAVFAKIQTLPIQSVRSCCQVLAVLCKDQLRNVNPAYEQELSEFVAEQDLGNMNDGEELNVCAELIWSQYLKLLKRHYSNSNYRNVARAKEYIHANYSNANLSLELVSDDIGVSTSSLSHSFKAICGCTFSHYVNKYRIEKAKELLESTNISVQEVGLVTGFQSMPTFFRVFKKYAGVTPGRYRQEH